MKRSLNILLASSAIFFASCSEDFLSELPTEDLSTEQLGDAAKQDPALLKGNIAGLYSTMYNAFTAQGAAAERHDDFGQKAYDIYMDMLSSDMVLAGRNYGWYDDISRYTITQDFTSLEASHAWKYYYKIIFAANTVIDALGGSDVVIEESLVEQREIMGQAKAMRAYAYFYLANLYGKEYGTGTDLILPLYTTTTVPNLPLSSTKDVYDLIVSDLTTAVDYLDGFNRTSKDQINKRVAQGLLAYALGARGTQADWQQVVTLTNEIISSNEFPLTTKLESAAILDKGVVTNPQSGFNNVATGSWMWGVDLTLASDLDLVSWWGVVDYYTYSYAAAGDPKTIDKGLYDKIPADDIRKKQFSATNFMPLYKFYSPERVPMGQRNVVTDYIYMRVDEMVLLNAEAHANLSQSTAAVASLEKLLSLRKDDISYLSSLTGQALKNEIYLQTRIEFWGEGKSYLAMKRNKATITRGSNHLSFVGQSYPYNDARLTFPIPQVEIQNNPQIN
ncbi:RagB/SusD family nutrient uptake outer membrane protein [Sphingobacterium sp. HJSM2_6]|uniref:RagB/SusD family nutrient uptake outer membrane protein n=1 Tax=Sphingobacterium sp. HJSM2_6 TaxID=3366264 RepID=UPI003BD10F95